MANSETEAFIQRLREKIAEMKQQELEEAEAILNGENKTEEEKPPPELLTNEYLRDVLKAEITDPTYAYRAGEKLSYDDWRGGVASEGERRDIENDIAQDTRNYYDARTRAIRAQSGKSGYGAYIANRQKQSYQASMREAAEALLSAYDDFYEDRTDKKNGTTTTRLNAVTYIASHGLSEQEGILYALAAGLSYEEAVNMARGAAMLGELINQHYITLTE